MKSPADNLPDDDSIDVNLRSIDEVVRRAVLLVTLLRRVAMEEPASPTDEVASFERETDRFDLYSWARTELAGSWIDEERQLLGTAAGNLNEAQVDRCLSALQPALALRWALGSIDSLTLCEDPAELEQLTDWSPEPWNDVARLARKSSLRPEAEIARERERWELWFWRATDGETDAKTGASVSAVVREIANSAVAVGHLDIAADDLAFDGTPFRALSTSDKQRIAERAESFLLALNWVCGFGPDWDSVPTYPD